MMTELVLAAIFLLFTNLGISSKGLRPWLIARLGTSLLFPPGLHRLHLAGKCLWPRRPDHSLVFRIIGSVAGSDHHVHRFDVHYRRADNR